MRSKVSRVVRRNFIQTIEKTSRCWNLLLSFILPLGNLQHREKYNHQSCIIWSLSKTFSFLVSSLLFYILCAFSCGWISSSLNPWDHCTWNWIFLGRAWAINFSSSCSPRFILSRYGSSCLSDDSEKDPMTHT